MDKTIVGDFESRRKKPDNEFPEDQMEFMRKLAQSMNVCGTCHFRTPGGLCTGGPPQIVQAPPKNKILAPGEAQKPVFACQLPPVAENHPACANYINVIAKQMEEMAIKYTYHPETMTEEELALVEEMRNGK